jgi:hypothetical protein
MSAFNSCSLVTKYKLLLPRGKKLVVNHTKAELTSFHICCRQEQISHCLEGEFSDETEDLLYMQTL